MPAPATSSTTGNNAASHSASKSAPRDVAGGVFVLKHRLDRTKETVALADANGDWLRGKLDAMHIALFERAKTFRTNSTRDAANYDELKKIIAEQGGFVRCWFEPSREVEAKIKEETKATVRCILMDEANAGEGVCVYSGKPTKTRVLFALSY